MVRRGGFYLKIPIFPKSRAGKIPSQNAPLSKRGRRKESLCEQGFPSKKKVTDIWFDEKDPLIHIRTHNTDLKKRLAPMPSSTPMCAAQTDAGPGNGLHGV